MNILIWLNGATNGPFQRQLPDGRIFSDLMNSKPVFSFPFVSIRYIEQANEFTVDGQPMTAEQKAEVLAAITAVAPPLGWYKAMKNGEIAGAYQGVVQAIAGQVEPVEMASWPKQEQQARAYLADQNAPTPLLDGLLVGRNLGETKAELAQKIVANADGYQVAYSTVLGKYQSLMKQLEAATTPAQVDALRW